MKNTKYPRTMSMIDYIFKFKLKLWISRWMATRTDTRILIDELAWRLGVYYNIEGEEATIENLRTRSRWYRSEEST